MWVTRLAFDLRNQHTTAIGKVFQIKCHKQRSYGLAGDTITSRELIRRTEIPQYSSLQALCPHSCIVRMLRGTTAETLPLIEKILLQSILQM